MKKKSDEERVAEALGPGWFEQACKAIEKETAHWPEWKKAAWRAYHEDQRDLW